MWLEELQLTDFRGFRSLTLDLRRRLTVVIGVNGAGKTSLVEALEIGASHAVSAVFHEPRAIPLNKRDLRNGQETCALVLRFEGTRVRVHRTASGNTERELQSADIELPPLCMVFKSSRAILASSILASSILVGGRGELEAGTQHPAWDDASQYITTFERGEQWFRAREDLENQERVRSKDFEHVDPGLHCVRRAIEQVLPSYSDPHIDRSRPDGPATSQLVLTKAGQELTADMLSEGERSLLILAMTIARRLAMLEPASPSEHAAVVVLDEIELHLHPAWQRAVVPSLLRAFPTCQFIVTTHSPQVIGSVPRESIVVLDDFAVYHAAAPTEGRDSNAILEEIMDVPERSEAARVELDEIAQLVDHDASPG